MATQGEKKRMGVSILIGRKMRDFFSPLTVLNWFCGDFRIFFRHKFLSWFGNPWRSWHQETEPPSDQFHHVQYSITVKCYAVSCTAVQCSSVCIRMNAHGRNMQLIISDYLLFLLLSYTYTTLHYSKGSQEKNSLVAEIVRLWSDPSPKDLKYNDCLKMYDNIMLWVQTQLPSLLKRQGLKLTESIKCTQSFSSSLLISCISGFI